MLRKFWLFSMSGLAFFAASMILASSVEGSEDLYSDDDALVSDEDGQLDWISADNKDGKKAKGKGKKKKGSKKKGKGKKKQTTDAQEFVMDAQELASGMFLTNFVADDEMNADDESPEASGQTEEIAAKKKKGKKGKGKKGKGKKGKKKKTTEEVDFNNVETLPTYASLDTIGSRRLDSMTATISRDRHFLLA